MISVACGSIASVLCVFGFSKLFHYSAGDLYSTASEISDYSYRHGCFRRTGGIVPITVAAIIVTGLFGSAIAVAICRLFKITDPVAKGLAIGTASHAVGTSKAIELGEVEGAMSGPGHRCCRSSHSRPFPDCFRMDLMKRRSFMSTLNVQPDLQDVINLVLKTKPLIMDAQSSHDVTVKGRADFVTRTDTSCSAIFKRTFGCRLASHSISR